MQSFGGKPSSLDAQNTQTGQLCDMQNKESSPLVSSKLNCQPNRSQRTTRLTNCERSAHLKLRPPRERIQRDYRVEYFVFVSPAACNSAESRNHWFSLIEKNARWVPLELSKSHRRYNLIYGNYPTTKTHSKLITLRSINYVEIAPLMCHVPAL